MAATTVRHLLAEAIQAAAPKWDVMTYPYTPNNVRRGAAVVSVYRTAIEPAASDLNIGHPVTINLYGAKTDSDALETELEGNHDVLLVALQGVVPFEWLRSERMVWNNGTMAGWQITGRVNTSNIYREAINERS